MYVPNLIRGDKTIYRRLRTDLREQRLGIRLDSIHAERGGFSESIVPKRETRRLTLETTNSAQIV